MKDPGTPAGGPTWLKRSLLTGLGIVLPAVVTLYILWLLFRVMGTLFAVPVEFVGRSLAGRPVDGMATTLIAAALTVGLLIAVGGIAQRVGRNAFHRIEERIFRRLPVARGIHRAVRQLFDLLFTEETGHKTVALVEYPRAGMYALGFVTSREVCRVDDAGGAELLSVYIPTTPNPTSGYLLLVPKGDVVPLDVSVEDAARIIISGGSLGMAGRVLRAAPGPPGPATGATVRDSRALPRGGQGTGA